MQDVIIIENPNLRGDLFRSDPGTKMVGPDFAPPAGVTSHVENFDSLVEVRAAKDLACIDIVICTRLPSGHPAVLLSKRKPTEAFGGIWWMYGGSLGAYVSMLDFIAVRAEKECGVPVRAQALIGVYRTSAADRPQSTLQPCYMTVASHEAIEAKMRTNEEHDTVKLFTLDELDGIPEAECHWYPIRVAARALDAMS